ncbi:MAG: HEAT repeat domain-containing protein [Spirochaetales bacterium]|jgi:epoxyqueuosine reductase|nr:HEAT repeat domain-containing protein [Spirochaetales bacterium]
MSLTQEIKEFALDLGYSKAGAAPADDFTDHIAELESRGDLYDFFTRGSANPLGNARPRTLVPQARSIITLVWDYFTRAFPENLLGKIGRVYQARCYNAPVERAAGARLQLMKNFVASKGCAICGPLLLPERRASARAGTASIGRNTFAYAKGIGSFIVLNSIVIDKELEYDTPDETCHCPKDCKACVKACPTGALYEPFKLNPKKCLGFNAWKTVEGSGWGITSSIPREIREKMDQRVHGCDLCQEACPRNQAKLKAPKPDDPYLVEVAKDFSLTKMLHMPEGFYEHRVQPLMYNYIKEPKYFQRNAAVALGNTKDPEYIPDLETEMNNPEEIIRSHTAWALGRIGTGEAKKILEAKRKTETSGAVQEEIEAALR